MIMMLMKSSMSQLRFTYLGVRAQKALRAATSQAVAEGEKLLNHILLAQKAPLDGLPGLV